MEPESQNTEYLYDVFYADKERLVSYLGQIDPNGVITNFEITTTIGNNETAKGGVNVGVAKGEISSGSSNSDGTKRTFDPAAMLPISVLNALDQKGFIGRNISQSALGSLVLSAGYLRIKDMRQSAVMWPIIEKAIPDNLLNPVVDPSLTQEEKKRIRAAHPGKALIKKVMGDLINNISMPIQMEMLTNRGQLWSTIKPDGVFSSIDDIPLKYGSVVNGVWYMLSTIDCFPGAGNKKIVENAWPQSEEDISSMFSNTVHSVLSDIKNLFGRPEDFFGVTPLIIFRKIPLNKDGSREHGEQEVLNMKNF